MILEASDYDVKCRRDKRKWSNQCDKHFLRCVFWSPCRFQVFRQILQSLGPRGARRALAMRFAFAYGSGSLLSKPLDFSKRVNLDFERYQKREFFR